MSFDEDRFDREPITKEEYERGERQALQDAVMRLKKHFSPFGPYKNYPAMSLERQVPVVLDKLRDEIVRLSGEPE